MLPARGVRGERHRGRVRAAAASTSCVLALGAPAAPVTCSTAGRSMPRDWNGTRYRRRRSPSTGSSLCRKPQSPEWSPSAPCPQRRCRVVGACTWRRETGPRRPQMSSELKEAMWERVPRGCRARACGPGPGRPSWSGLVLCPRGTARKTRPAVAGAAVPWMRLHTSPRERRRPLQRLAACCRRLPGCDRSSHRRACSTWEPGRADQLGSRRRVRFNQRATLVPSVTWRWRPSVVAREQGSGPLPEARQRRGRSDDDQLATAGVRSRDRRLRARRARPRAPERVGRAVLDTRPRGTRARGAGHSGRFLTVASGPQHPSSRGGRTSRPLALMMGDAPWRPRIGAISRCACNGRRCIGTSRVGDSPTRTRSTPTWPPPEARSPRGGAARALARPRKGHVRVWLCEPGGLNERVISRRDGELYRPRPLSAVGRASRGGLIVPAGILARCSFPPSNHPGGRTARRCSSWFTPGVAVRSGPPPPEAVFVGMLGGLPCWAVELDDESEADPEARDLRSLWSEVDHGTWTAAGRAVQLVEWARTHRYCGRCGSPTEDVSGLRAKRCLRCGLEAFPRLSPAVICLVEHDDGTALLARGPQFTAGMFSCLAGFVEDQGETLEEAVARSAGGGGDEVEATSGTSGASLGLFPIL